MDADVRRRWLVSFCAFALAIAAAWAAAAILVPSPDPDVLALAFAPETINLTLGPPIRGVVAVNLTVMSSDASYFGARICWQAQAIGLVENGTASIDVDPSVIIREVPPLHGGSVHFFVNVTGARSDAAIQAWACTASGGAPKTGAHTLRLVLPTRP
jgi:hypothetical protein